MIFFSFLLFWSYIECFIDLVSWFHYTCGWAQRFLMLVYVMLFWIYIRCFIKSLSCSIVGSTDKIEGENSGVPEKTKDKSCQSIKVRTNIHENSFAYERIYKRFFHCIFYDLIRMIILCFFGLHIIYFHHYFLFNIKRN